MNNMKNSKINNKPAIAIFYNLFSVFAFFIIYYLIQDQFQDNIYKNKIEFADIVNLSITLQTSAGYSNLSPKTTMAKWFVATQQTLLIFGNLIILHI